MSHHHLLKNLWHSIKQFFSSANTTVHKTLTDPNLGNKLKVAGYVKKGIEELMDYAQTKQPKSHQENTPESGISKEDNEIIEGFKTFFKELSEKQAQIDKKVIDIHNEFGESRKNITQLSEEVKKQKDLNSNLQFQLNALERKYEEGKKQMQVFEAKQRLRDKQLVFAFSLLLIFATSIGYLFYKLYKI